MPADSPDTDIELGRIGVRLGEPGPGRRAPGPPPPAAGGPGRVRISNLLEHRVGRGPWLILKLVVP